MYKHLGSVLLFIDLGPVYTSLIYNNCFVLCFDHRSIPDRHPRPVWFLHVPPAVPSTSHRELLSGRSLLRFICIKVGVYVCVCAQSTRHPFIHDEEPVWGGVKHDYILSRYLEYCL